MDILILGSGAREVAIVKNILRNPSNYNNNNDNSNNDNLKNETLNLYYSDYKENIQLNKLCKKYIKLTDIINRNTEIDKELNDFVKNINYIIIGPEKYLGSFVKDKILKNQIDIPIFGPNKCAILENSKSYTRNFIQLIDNKFNPEFEIIDNKHNDITDDYIKSIMLDYQDKYNGFVIKPDGLTGGKGVKLYPDNFNNIFDCLQYCKIQDVFIIEEKLVGEEFSLMCFTDGINSQFMPIVQDYKRAYEFDKGANTGSMGSLCDYVNESHKPWFLNNEEVNNCQTIMSKTIECINKKCEEKYKGVLYGSFIKTKNGLKLIEYNCRFGDPEAINVLSLLNTSILDIVIHCHKETLNNIKLNWSNKTNLLVYLVPYGYPDFSNVNTDTNLDSKFDNLDIKPYITLDLNNEDIYVASLSKILSNTDIKDKETNMSLYKPNCSRTYAVLFQYENLQDCKRNSLDYFKNTDINLNVLRYRNDIGNKYLELKSKNIYTVEGGVNTVEVGNSLDNVKANILSTYNENMVSNYGSFSGEFKFKDSILMASTDGVGTKSILLNQVFGLDGFKILGQDLVNHNINDILVNGGYPLFFLDYYGCNNFNHQEFAAFISGATYSCKKYNTVLFGGETAIMKDIYRKDECDFVGTIIGYKKFTFSQKYNNDDVLIGIPSSGFHTNGYSLLRKIYTKELEDGIREPHKCYLPLIENLVNNDNIDIKALSHITGGGFYDNIDRVIPRDKYVLNINDFEFPTYYNTIFNHYGKEECINLFNCGYGLIIITNINNLDTIKKYEPLSKIIGNITN